MADAERLEVADGAYGLALVQDRLQPLQDPGAGFTERLRGSATARR